MRIQIDIFIVINSIKFNSTLEQFHSFISVLYFRD